MSSRMYVNCTEELFTGTTVMSYCNFEVPLESVVDSA